MRHLVPHLSDPHRVLAFAAAIGFGTAAACSHSAPNTPTETPEGPDTVAASVAVSPSVIALNVGETTQLGATVRNAANAVLAGAAVSWSTGNPTVAAVSASGLVTGIGDGSTDITATAQSATGSAAATVTAPPPPSGDECDSPQAAWVWCDDFEQNRMSSYFEYDNPGGSFTRTDGVGRDSSYGMRVQFAQGQVSAGFLHLAMGRTPQAYFQPVDAGTADYREIYWRMFVRNQAGWTGGGGDKLSRATIFSSQTTWAQAMVAHVWSGTPPNERVLGIDPVRGTDAGGTVVTTTYNDFPNFTWLGWQPGATLLFDDGNVGPWYCVEARARLNDAGQSNGVFQLWVNGNLEASRTNLNFVGAFNDYGINAVFFENYWNAGSPQAQERYFDNIVISTQPIGCTP